MQRLGRIDERARPEHAEALPAADEITRAEHTRVHARIATERVVQAPRVLEVARQLRVELADRKGRVRVEVRLGPLDARARPVPRLSLRVACAHEEHVAMLVVHAAQHRDRFRLVVAREVEEVRVLPEGVLDVVVPDVHRRRRDHGDVARELREERLAPAAQLVAERLARCERVRRGCTHGIGAGVGGHRRHSTAAPRATQGRPRTISRATRGPACGLPRRGPRSPRAPRTTRLGSGVRLAPWRHRASRPCGGCGRSPRRVARGAP
jgi:hypothetical protein